MGKISLDITTDASKLLDGTEQGIAGLKNLSVQSTKTKGELNSSFQDAGNAMNNFNSKVSSATQTLSAQGKVVLDLINKYGSAKQAYGAVTRELLTLEATGQRNTATFKSLSLAAADLKHSTRLVTGELERLSSSTHVFDQIAEGARGMTAAFEVGAGVTALFGEKNADLEKTIQKTQGAMALAMGVQELARLATEKGGIVTGFATAAQGAYATVTGLVTGELAGATVAQQAFNAALAFSPIGAILLTLSAIALIYKVISDRAAFAKQEFEDFVEFLQFGEEDVQAAIERTNQENKNRIALLQAQKASEEDIHNARRKAIEEEITGNRELLQVKTELQKKLQEQFENAKPGSDEEEKLNKQLIANQDAIDKLLLQNGDFLDQLNIEDASFKQKTLENERAFQQSLFDLKQRAAKEAEIFQTGEQRIATETKIGLLAISQLRKQIELENKERGHAAELTVTQEEQLRILKDVIFRKAADDRLAIFRQEEQDVLNLMDDGRQKEIETVELKYAALRDKFKDNALILRELVGKEEKEIAAIDTKFNISSLDANEAHQLSLLNQQQRSGMSELAFEQFKAGKKLEILQQFGEAEIALIEAQIPVLSEEEKKKAQAQIDAIKEKIAGAKKELKTISQKSDGFSFGRLLFGDDFTDEQIGKIDNAITQISDNISKTLNTAFDTAIKTQQNFIDSLDKRIEKQKEVVANEQKLAKEGAVNNLAIETEQLNKLNAAREKALEKQKKIKNAQVALDTISQLSSLITAAAKVYESLANIPVVGVPLATALVATMFAAFAASKVSAAVLTAQSGGFREGGYTGDGDPSETSTAIGKRPYKYHKKEFVANEQMTLEGRDLLDAWHKGDKEGIIYGIADLLKNTGVVMPDQNLPRKLSLAKEVHDQINRDEGNSELRKLREELVEIKEELQDWKKKPKEETISHGDTLIIRKGNSTRRIRK